MMNRISLLLILIAVVTLVLLRPSYAQEEKPPEARIVHQVLEDKPGEGLSVKIFLNVRDSTGRLMMLNDIDTISFQLNPSEPTISAKPSLPPEGSPIKIALLLDESGSMLSYLKLVRQKIKDAIGSMPDQAEIAIFKFSGDLDPENMKPDINFTTNRDELKEFVEPGNINQPKYPNYYNPQNLNATCLNDATLGVVNYLNSNLSANERRAVILFTDGTDEKILPNETKVRCSKYPIEAAVLKAVPDYGAITPIYTIGLCPTAMDKDGCPDVRLDENTVRGIAQSTRAISKVGSIGDLQLAFVDIARDIQAQIYVSTTLRPCDEDSAGVIIGIKGEREPGRTRFPIQSSCYTPRAVIILTKPNIDPKTYEATFTLNINNTSSITMNSVKYQIYTPGNTEIYRPLRTKEFVVSPRSHKSLDIPIPVSDLGNKLDRPYVIKIYAEGNGLQFLRKPDEPTYDTESYREEIDKSVLAVDNWEPRFPGDLALGTPAINTVTTSEITLRFHITGNDKRIFETLLSNPTYYSINITEGGCKLKSPNAASVKYSSQDSSVNIEALLDEEMSKLAAPQSCKLRVLLTLPVIENVTQQPEFFESEESASFTIPAMPARGFWEKYGRSIGIGFLVVLSCATGVAVIFYLRRRPEPLPDPRQPVGGRDPVTELKPKMPDPAPRPSAKPSPKPPLAAKPRQEPPVVSPPDATVIVDDRAPPTPHLRARVAQSDDEAMEGQELTFSTFPIVVGRVQGDLIIRDPKVSNPHAEIALAPDAKSFVLTILKSSNRTFVGAQQLEAGTTMSFTDRIVMRLGPKTVVELTPKL